MAVKGVIELKATGVHLTWGLSLTGCFVISEHRAGFY